jgi:hypothetical protein
MAWYRTGTANVTNGQSTVVGNGTAWATNGIQPGDVFTVDNITLYEVQAVGSDTSLTIDRPFTGASTGIGDFESYAIIQNLSPFPATVLATLQTLSGQYGALLAQIGSMASQNKTAVQIQGGTIDGTVIGGTTPAAGTFTNLAAATVDGAVLGSKQAAAGTFTSLTAETSISLVNNQATQTDLMVENTNSKGAAAVVFSTDTADVCSFGAFGSTATPGGIIPAGGAFLFASGTMTFEVGSLRIGNTAEVFAEVNASGRTLLGSTVDDGVHQLQVNGLASAATPAVGDNSTSLATTAWVQEQFAGSLAASGQQPLPNGFLLQWGKLTTTAATDTVTFTKPFPNACFGVTGNVQALTAFGEVQFSAVTTTTFEVAVSNGSADVALPIFWIAIGH